MEKGLKLGVNPSSKRLKPAFGFNLTIVPLFRMFLNQVVLRIVGERGQNATSGERINRGSLKGRPPKLLTAAYHEMILRG